MIARELLIIIELRYLLLRDDINSIYISLDITKSFNINTSNDNIGNKYMMICPKWLKTIAYYQHTIGVCLPLLIQVCFNKCYSSNSSNGNDHSRRKRHEWQDDDEEEEEEEDAEDDEEEEKEEDDDDDNDNEEEECDHDHDHDDESKTTNSLEKLAL